MAIYLHTSNEWIVRSGASSHRHLVYKDKPGGEDGEKIAIEKWNLSFLAQLQPQTLVSHSEMITYGMFGERYKKAKLVHRLTGEWPNGFNQFT